MLPNSNKGGLRITDTETLIQASGLFIANWYIETYPDAGGPENALKHFLNEGSDKGYDPGPSFSTQDYLAQHRDVAASGMNALLHYLRFGQGNGRIMLEQSDRVGGPGDLQGTALARIKDAFDAKFYVATNPDLPSDIDAFAHFMSEGWAQNRDPAGWFSIAHYLLHHNDVATNGRNPFVHYVLKGCREGRSIAPSTRKSHDPFARNKAQRIGVVSMLRNEADIIRFFAAHVLALFDEIVLIDHGSIDGTTEFLEQLAAQFEQVTLMHLDEVDFLQSVALTHVMRELPVLRNADWVFSLDADEFLPFENRGELDEALAGYDRCPVISITGQHLVPTNYGDGALPSDQTSVFLTLPKGQAVQKIAFQPARVPIQRMVMGQDMRSLLETQNGLVVPAFEAGFSLLHLPVRSADQVMMKLHQGVRAFETGQRQDRLPQADHWQKMRAALTDRSFSDQVMNGLAASYSLQPSRITPISEVELVAKGFVKSTFALAQSGRDLPEISSRTIGELLLKIYGADPAGQGTGQTSGVATLQITGNRLQRAEDVFDYPQLPDLASFEKAQPIADIVKRLLRPSYDPIPDAAASDWTTHAPFMSAVTALVRPRRFVDIGTGQGASFAAFAQTARKIGLTADAVAVSTWAGEDHQFESFRFLAEAYGDTAAILRLPPDQAIERFSDGSIDLMHLDGYASYDSVARDFETWMPKLSESGVVLMHDIHAHRQDFGVWRLWDDLKATFPTLEFAHDQGLGLACIGKAVPADLVSLCQKFRLDASLATLLQEHFEQMGRLSAEMSSRRAAMAQMEMRTASENGGAEEIGKLRQKLQSALSEAADLRAAQQAGLTQAVAG